MIDQHRKETAKKGFVMPQRQQSFVTAISKIPHDTERDTVSEPTPLLHHVNPHSQISNTKSAVTRIVLVQHVFFLPFFFTLVSTLFAAKAEIILK